MKKADKEMLELLFGTAVAAAMIEEATKGKTKEETPVADTEPEATEAKTNPHQEAVQEVRDLYNAFIAEGFNANQATRFTAAILSK